MKISVVIPTRNRLEYLKTALASIIAQDYDNWETIVSDNHSSEDIQSFITSLNEPRIKYSRTDHFISVTDNWNRALDLSTGDYVILIGDDDCLMQGTLSILHNLILEHSAPELIFANGLLYAYPNCLPSHPNGHLTTIGNWNLWNSKIPIMIEPEKLRDLCHKSANFQLYFSYNLQILTIRRSLIEKLKIQGFFFHSPYPDFYAFTMLFQKAEKVLFCPYPLAIVGLSPKSFGGQYFNKKEDKGIEDLNIDKEANEYPELNKYILPGTKLNTYWLFALRCAQKNLSNTTNLIINFSRYRSLQIAEYLLIANTKPNRFKCFFRLFRCFYLNEILTHGINLWYIYFIGQLFKGKSNEIIHRMIQNLNTHPGHYNYQFKNHYNSIMEVFNKITPHECTSHFK